MMSKEVEPIVISTLFGVEYFGPDYDNRPSCEYPGCDALAAPRHSYKKGSEMYRRGTDFWRNYNGVYVCQKHHEKYLEHKRNGNV